MKYNIIQYTRFIRYIIRSEHINKKLYFYIYNYSLSIQITMHNEIDKIENLVVI